MALLTVYKASAGSGKTFRLTLEYLKLIIGEPDAFRHILAVTFTHKATAEMKNRIISELHKLAGREETETCRLICEELSVSSAYVFDRAEQLLKAILHNYSQFHISTIDSFFHTIITSFARDLGLQGNFTIELNNSKVLNAVVDEIMMELADHPRLARWLVDFADEKLSQGKSWELRDEIKRLGSELFREDYGFDKLILSPDEQKNLIGKVISQIAKSKANIQSRLTETGKEAASIMTGNGLDLSDFNFGSRGVMGYLVSLEQSPLKAPYKKALEAVDHTEAWLGSKSKKAPLAAHLVESNLNASLKEALKLQIEWQTADQVGRNLYALGILSNLKEKIISHTQEKNLFLIDQSPWLINRLIDNNDTPFIYERAGNHYHHFMIDEFQDTSVLQWQNFLPLIHNSLSQDYPCMLVGDVKQSIYRWRNSSWKTLADIEHGTKPVDIENLGTNYRSRPMLIRFNNSMFSQAPQTLQDWFNKEFDVTEANPYTDLIIKAYRGVAQQIPAGDAENIGYAGFAFVSEDSEQKESIPQMQEGRDLPYLKEMKVFVDQLLENNYQQKEIAILVRKKAEGTRVAEFLLQSGTYRVISNDSLLVRNSLSVKLLVSLFIWLYDETDSLNNLFLIEELKEDAIERENTSAGRNAYCAGENPGTWLPQELVSAREKLENLPLYDLAEYLISLLNLHRKPGQYPYLQAFLDIVHDYCTGNATTLASFLEWWKENGDSFTINAPEEQDAIRIITIHKAKGLQYRAVIIPFCNWELDHGKNQPVLWCDTKDTPYHYLGPVPVRYNSRMADSQFSPEYYREKIQVYVDNLNLLYVAFTRAMDCLFAICPADESKARKVSHLILEVLDMEDSGLMADPGLSFRTAERKDGRISFGKIPVLEKMDMPAIQPEYVKASAFPAERIRIKAHSEEYFLPITNPARETRINQGKILHDILAGVTVLDDISPALQKLIHEGKISQKEKELYHRKILDITSDPLVAGWFGPEWQVIRELPYVEKGKNIEIPDRVMISGSKAVVVDYKSGENKSEGHHSQVRKYMHAMDRMGYTDVKGFIWYLKLSEIDEVVRT